MKKIGIVFFHNLRYAPFIKYYTNLLDTVEGVEYEIIYYNRDRSLGEPNNEQFISVPWIGRGTSAAPKIEKAVNFVFWKIYVNNLLRRKNYDFIIVSMTTAAVLVEQYLTKKYSGRYIFDIRDYTQEHVKRFFEAEKRLVANSKMNVISSPGFEQFLPKAKYYICHNFVMNSKETIHFKKSQLPIRISYIGSISYEEQCIQLMRLVDRDERFSFFFYGNENTSNRVSSEVRRIDNPRIKMKGPFVPDEKKKIYGESALVFNCYGNKQPLVLYAISNKHYDGAFYKVPVLNSPGTIMDELAKENGYTLDLDNLTDLDGLYNWYMNLDDETYEQYAEGVIKNAIEENENTKQAIISAILS